MPSSYYVFITTHCSNAVFLLCFITTLCSYAITLLFLLPRCAHMVSSYFYYHAVLIWRHLFLLPFCVLCQPSTIFIVTLCLHANNVELNYFHEKPSSCCWFVAPDVVIRGFIVIQSQKPYLDRNIFIYTFTNRQRCDFVQFSSIYTT